MDECLCVEQYIERLSLECVDTLSPQQNGAKPPRKVSISLKGRPWNIKEHQVQILTEI